MQWKNCVFEVNIEETDSFRKDERIKSSAKIKMNMQKDGSCSARLDCYDEQGKQTESIIVFDSTIYTVVYTSKSILQTKLKGNVTKKDMADFAQVFFPMLPFFVLDRNEVHKQFKTEIVQQDQDYTWIRFVPQHQSIMRNYSIAQLGIINYANALSPQDFPLRMMWKDPGIKEFSWTFKAIQLNQDALVTASDFQIDVEQMKKKGWTFSANDALLRWAFAPTPSWVDDRTKEKKSDSK